MTAEQIRKLLRAGALTSLISIVACAQGISADEQLETMSEDLVEWTAGDGAVAEEALGETVVDGDDAEGEKALEPGVFQNGEGFYYRVSGDAAHPHAVIVGYESIFPDVLVPEEVDGYPVREIAEGAFSQDETIAYISIPECVEKLGAYAAGYIKTENGYEKNPECVIECVTGSPAAVYVRENGLECRLVEGFDATAPTFPQLPEEDAETEAQSEAETAVETEAQSEKETAAETEAPSEAETTAETEEQTETETPAEENEATEAVTETEAPAETETVSENETEAVSEEEPATENETEAVSEEEPATEDETEAVSEAEPATEDETETTSERAPETETEAGELTITWSEGSTLFYAGLDTELTSDWMIVLSDEQGESYPIYLNGQALQTLEDEYGITAYIRRDETRELWHTDPVAELTQAEQAAEQTPAEQTAEPMRETAELFDSTRTYETGSYVLELADEQNTYLSHRLMVTQIDRHQHPQVTMGINHVRSGRGRCRYYEFTPEVGGLYSLGDEALFTVFYMNEGELTSVSPEQTEPYCFRLQADVRYFIGVSAE
ncbi:MAG: hypothetical protein Q4B59_00750 [Lachnospiraceae bacterium]|nr:hypothetical protein [Lachnospiraceae bacterium]